jgi:hypothetical protein
MGQAGSLFNYLVGDKAASAARGRAPTGEHTVAEEVLLKAGDVEITAKLARFGGISYRVANIGSVSVYSARKINPIAAVLVFVG